MTVRAAIYCRISKDLVGKRDQGGIRAGEGLGVDRQETLCRKLAKARGWTVAEKAYVDNEISAFSGKRRPAYEQMLADVDTGLVNAILCVDQDRLVRRVSEVARIIELCEKRKALILLDSGEIDTTSADGILKAHILAAVGENEGRKQSTRRKRQLEQNAFAGKPHGGKRPFGYNDDRRTLHPVEGPAYQELFGLVIDGTSLTQIAKLWDARGLRNWNGERFTVSSLRHKIAAPRAIGMRLHQRKVIGRGDWTPIVSEAVQRQALAALKSRRKRQLRSTGNPTRPARLLSSLVVCDVCGEKMRVRKSGGTHYYTCDRVSNSRSCGGCAIRSDLVEAHVERGFLALLTRPQTHKALERLRRQAPDTRDLLDEIERLEMELAALAQDAGSGEISRSEWQTVRKGTQVRLDAARARLDAVTDDAVLLGMSPSETHRKWTTEHDLDERRRALAAWIDVVRVKPFSQTKKRHPAHGTVERYWDGCKCAPCKAANAEYSYKRRRGQTNRRSGSTRQFRPERVVVEWRI